MKPARVNEAEVVDTVVGGAGGEVECRVEQVRRVDETAAWQDRYWSDFVQLVRRQTRPTREMAARIEARVMERLPDEAGERERWLDAPLESPLEAWPRPSPMRWLGKFWDSRDSYYGRGAAFLRRHGARLTVAALMALGIYCGKRVWRAAYPEARLYFAESAPQVAALPALAAATALTGFPHVIDVGVGHSGRFAIPAGVTIDAEGGTQIELADGSHATQARGEAVYRMPQPPRGQQAFEVKLDRFNITIEPAASELPASGPAHLFELSVSDKHVFSTSRPGIYVFARQGDFIIRRNGGGVPVERLVSGTGVKFDVPRVVD